MTASVSGRSAAVREGRRRLGITLTDIQRRAVDNVLAGRDTLLVSPTGSGKSAVYQLAGALTAGITVVVSPLIALQEDQLAGFEDVDVGDAVVINSLRGARARRASLQRLTEPSLEFVLLGPEQLIRDDVRAALRRRSIDRLVVDEAHCVDLWGPDLRPPYLALGAVRRDLGSPPALAMTATAPAHVRAEIADVLVMRKPVEVLAPAERRNIDLAVIRHAGRDDLEAAVVDEAARRRGSGLVYVGRRYDAEALAARLDERGRRAFAYHGSLPAARRRAAHEAFAAGGVVVVATSAFGLGIDVPDVRFVLHTDAPETIDSYAQEIGRAGRDGEPASAALHVAAGQAGRRRFAAGRSLPESELCAAVATITRPTPLVALRRHLGPGEGRVLQAVRLLEQHHVVRLTADLVVEPGTTEWPQVAERVDADLERRATLLRTRRDMIDWYTDGAGCRWAALTGYLGGAEVVSCGHCDVCGAGGDGRRQAQAGGRRVKHPQFGSGSVLHDNGDRITVLFDDAGYRTLSKQILDDPTAAGSLRTRH